MMPELPAIQPALQAFMHRDIILIAVFHVAYEAYFAKRAQS